MEMKRFQLLYEQGYRFATDDSDVDEIDGYELVELDDVWLRKLLSGEEHIAFYNDEGDARLYRLAKPHQISAGDVIHTLTGLLSTSVDVETVRDAFAVFDSAIGGKRCFVPSGEVDNTLGADPFFYDSNHLVKFALAFVLNHQERRLEKDLGDLVVFLTEISKTNGYHPKTNFYSKETFSLLLWNLAEFVSKDGSLPKELAEFYLESLAKLAQEGDYRSVRMAGYEFYEGTNGFEANPHRALELLTKAYEMEEDPDIARTLGYIYYYGRTSGGVPQGDKAFQYFSIGHNAGGYYEATYKLADCYIEGYGTPICHEAAFRLVSGIYGETLSHYLSGEDFTKFADVALRLGSYYRDGVFVKKNLQEAYAYYLEARAAIRSRLAAGEYIGDRGVAAGIASAIVGLESQLGRKTERQIKNGGYLIPNISEDYHRCVIEYERADESHLRVTLRSGSNESMLFLEPSLGLCERAKEITLLLAGNYDDEVMEKLADLKPTELLLGGEEPNAIFLNEDGSDWLLNRVEEAIYYPTTIKELAHRYALVSVEFYPGSKTYDYLSSKDAVKEGDVLRIVSRGEEKKVRVKSVRLCYEDELPLPLSKMSIAK
jgi:TPR repeat protein